MSCFVAGELFDASANWTWHSMPRSQHVISVASRQVAHNRAARSSFGSLRRPTDETLKRFLEELLSYPDVPNRWRMPDWDGAPPGFLSINYR